MEIIVDSILYDAGVTEDGQRFHAEAYRVIVEFASGQRFRLRHSFPGCRVEKDLEDGFNHFIDIRLEAEAEAIRIADKIRARVAAGGDLDLDNHWTEIEGVYGTIYGLDGHLAK